MSAPSPLLFEVLCMTCLHVVLGNYQQRSLTFSLPLSRHIVAKVIRYNDVLSFGELPINMDVDGNPTAIAIPQIPPINHTDLILSEHQMMAYTIITNNL